MKRKERNKKCRTRKKEENLKDARNKMRKKMKKKKKMKKVDWRGEEGENQKKKMKENIDRRK